MPGRRGSIAVVAVLVASGCGGALRSHGGDADDDTGADAVTDAGQDTEDDTAGEPSPDTEPDAPEDSIDDPIPDGPCVSMGCIAREGAECCAGLVEVGCIVGMDCVEAGRFCIGCGSGGCEPHENAMNCPGDCPGGCDVDDTLSFACSPIESQSCTCILDPCTPFCDMMRGPAWIDACTDAPIPGSGDPACFPFGEIHCLHIGDTTEGWYDTQWEGEHLVKLGPCQPRWQCEIIW